MRKMGAIFLSLALVLAGVGLPMLLISTNDKVQVHGGIPIAPLSIWPPLPPVYPAALAPVPFEAMNVYYWDNDRRVQTMADTSLRLLNTTAGLIHDIGGWSAYPQPIGAHYQNYSGIVGGTGTFQLILTEPTLAQYTGTGGLTVVEFAPPRANDTSDFVWENLNITARPTDNPRVFLLTVPYTRVGVYRVTIRTVIGGNVRHNVYWMTVRNRFRGEDWRIETRLHASMTIGGSANINISANSSASSWNLNVWQNRNIPATIRLAGVGVHEDIVNLSIHRGTGENRVDVLRNSDNSLNLFEVEGGNGLEYIQIRRRRVYNEHGQSVPIDVPTGVYAIRARVRVTMNNMSPSGVIENVEPFYVYWSSTLTFNPPPTPRGFPWVMLIVSLLVLGALGGGIAGTTYLIQRSQENHSLKLGKKARQIAEVEEQNFDQLRQGLNDEYEEERQRIEMYRIAVELANMDIPLDEDKGKDIKGKKGK